MPGTLDAMVGATPLAGAGFAWMTTEAADQAILGSRLTNGKMGGHLDALLLQPKPSDLHLEVGGLSLSEGTLGMATEKNRTPMKADDWVVHPSHGVGRIISIETREFSQGAPHLYYRIAIPTGTVWVPVDGSGAGLRKLTAKDDLERYRQLLSGQPSALPSGYRERQLALLERLKQSSFEARCKVLRDLSALGWHKRLNQGNAGLLRIAHRDVCTEWAAAAGVSFNEAGAHIGSLLLEGRKTFDSQ